MTTKVEPKKDGTLGEKCSQVATGSSAGDAARELESKDGWLVFPKLSDEERETLDRMSDFMGRRY
jgi:hypothetical protein